MALTMTTRCHHWHVVVDVSGVADDQNLSSLHARLLDAVNTMGRRRHVVVDLSRLEQLDPRAASPIAAAHWRVLRLGGSLSLVAPHQPLRRTLMLASMDWLMPIYPDAGEALRDLQKAGPPEQVERLSTVRVPGE